MAAQWEERLAAYVRSAFRTTMLGAKGQNAIQYVSKLSTAALLLFGAKAVIDGELTIGELVAFNMIAGQVAQPVLRLSQLWQDFQQVQVSVERLGDILNSPVGAAPASSAHLPPPRGKIEFRNVCFRYRPGAPQVAQTDFAAHQSRRGHRHRRAVGFGQIDADQADPALLHPRGRPGSP